MRFIATIFAIFACFTSNIYARCILTTNESPALANIRLGMTPGEVNTALAGATRVKVKNDGHYSYFKSYLKKGKAKGVLTGARAFYVRFFDKQVYQIEIFYHRESGTSDLDSFLRGYSTQANFDFENFEIKHGYAAAKCDGFLVEADNILNPHIELTDLLVKEKVKESRK